MLNRGATIPLDDRVALIEALQAAGLPYIEAGAFVSAKRIPAMADTPELFKRLSPYDGQLAVLVPNLKHFERAAGTPNLDAVALFVSASEYYSRKNTRMSIEETLTAVAEERSRRGRTGVYDVTVSGRAGRLIALFRCRSHRLNSKIVSDLDAAGEPS